MLNSRIKRGEENGKQELQLNRRDHLGERITLQAERATGRDGAAAHSRNPSQRDPRPFHPQPVKSDNATSTSTLGSRFSLPGSRRFENQKCNMPNTAKAWYALADS
jgi:hypothetical protein